MKKIAAAIVSLMMVLTTGACSNNPFRDRWADAEKEVMAADSTITRAYAYSGTSGFALDWSIDIYITGDSFTAQQLHSVIDICMDHLTRDSDVSVYVIAPDGADVDLRPAYKELGFEVEAHTNYTEATRESGDPSDFKDVYFEFSRVYIENVLGT